MHSKYCVLSGITEIANKIINSHSFKEAVDVKNEDDLRIILIDALTATYLASNSKCAKTYGKNRFFHYTPREMKQLIRNTEPPDGTDYRI